MKILIVDDEFNARRVIRKLLLDRYEKLNFTIDASSVDEAIAIIDEEAPDIIFMDIQLGESKSFEIFDRIKVKGELIFVTAYDQYTKEAFNLDAINYIVKPIQREKLYSAFERAKKLSGNGRYAPENPQSADRIGKIILPASGDHSVVNVDDIVYAVAEGSYCRIFFEKNRSSIIVKPLVFLEKKLSDYPYMFRVHKSYLVNLKRVKNVAGDLTYLAVSADELIPVSRQKKQEVRKVLNDFFY